MSTSENIIQLKQAGDGITLRVRKCEKMKIGTYPEVEFTGVDATGRECVVRVPEKASDRQLERAGLTRDTAIGHTLNFTRDANGQDPKKPFWGVTVADAPIDAPQRVATAPAAKPSAQQPTPSGAPEAPNAEVHTEKRSVLYEKITDHVLKKIVPKYVSAGIPITQEGTAAIIATLFINACNHH